MPLNIKYSRSISSPMYKTGSDIFLGTDIDLAPENEKTTSNKLNVTANFNTNLSDYFNDNLDNLFPKENDKRVASSILYLCKNKDNIDNFNKKALYIMIREMTDVKTSKITQVSNVFRKIYPKIQEEVISKGHINDLNRTGSL